MANANYLAFARKHFGHARFDFALSGEHPAACLEPPRGDGRAGDHEALREALAAFLGRSVDEVVPCIGTSQAMALAGACLGRHGSTIALEEPVYEPLRLAFADANVVRVVRESAAAYRLERASVNHVQSTSAMVFADPHNPTGAAADPAALRAVLASYPGSVVVDEVYAPFDDYLDADGRWPGRGRDLHPRAWAIGSLTKAYGLGPYRVGWLIVPPEERARVDEAVVRAVGEMPRRWASDALDVLAQVPRIAEELRATLPARRALVIDALASVPGLELHVPARGPYAWMRAPKVPNVLDHVVRWAENDGLVVSPGFFFGDAQGLRVAWTSPLVRLREGVPLLIRRLTEMMQSAPR
jgi:aspartate/methionine/tyrosine aminotransferase